MSLEERKFSRAESKACDELLELLEQELSRIKSMIMDDEKVYKINRSIVYATQHAETMLGAISCINCARIMGKKEDDDR